MSDARVRSARRGPTAYLITVVVLSAIVEGVLIVSRSELFLVLMLMPARTSAIVRLARHEGCRDVSVSLGTLPLPPGL